MINRVLADATMVVHFAFLLFVVFGGFFAWRWPKAIFVHLLAASWGLVIVVFAVTCPLTHVENHFRRAAGQRGLSRGFIDQYIENVLYPERYTNLLRALAAAVVLVSWVGAYRRWRRRAARHGALMRG